MRIVFAGTPEVASDTLSALVSAGYEIPLVITRPDAPVGRKRVLTPSPVATMANSLAIPTLKTDRIDSEGIIAIRQAKPDVGVVVAFGALLKTDALAAAPFGWLNLHYSLLPRWRGAAPVQRALLAGDKETGVTLFRLDVGMDTGPVFGRVQTLVEPGESAADLLNRLSGLGISLLLQELPRIGAGLAFPEPQPIGDYPVASKISRSDAEIDWRVSARDIENMVRAFNPEPGAFTFFDGQPFRVLGAVALGPTDRFETLSEASLGQDFGHVRLSGKLITVECGQGTLLALREVQPAGKQPMSAADWFRGIGQKNPKFGSLQ